MRREIPLMLFFLLKNKLVLAELEELESIRAYDAAVSSGDEIIAIITSIIKNTKNNR